MTEDDGTLSAAREMPQYISHKKVWALEIKAAHLGHADGTYSVSFRDAGYADMTLPSDMFIRYTPSPGDFLVQYADGYKSFSPRKAFLEGYTRA